MSVTKNSLIICTLQGKYGAGAYAPAPYGTATSFRRQLAVDHRYVDAHALAALFPEEVPGDAQHPGRDEDDIALRGELLRRGVEDEVVEQDAQVDEAEDGTPHHHRQPLSLIHISEPTRP